ncbi:unnamed protein product [Caenorhabditis angaria]|uniref:Domain of unknown function DX domain-containing protein n=1 Tax=Caenorhabditis angaria TaxID=860376 RepID=A0A9P1N2Y3_9PELO|nr:unnamed protein product [Caenorhabditis angaria]
MVENRTRMWIILALVITMVEGSNENEDYVGLLWKVAYTPPEPPKEFLPMDFDTVKNRADLKKCKKSLDCPLDFFCNEPISKKINKKFCYRIPTYSPEKYFQSLSENAIGLHLCNINDHHSSNKCSTCRKPAEISKTPDNAKLLWGNKRYDGYCFKEIEVGCKNGKVGYNRNEIVEYCKEEKGALSAYIFSNQKRIVCCPRTYCKLTGTKNNFRSSELDLELFAMCSHVRFGGSAGLSGNLANIISNKFVFCDADSIICPYPFAYHLFKDHLMNYSEIPSELLPDGFNNVQKTPIKCNNNKDCGNNRFCGPFLSFQTNPTNKKSCYLRNRKYYDQKAGDDCNLDENCLDETGKPNLGKFICTENLETMLLASEVNYCWNAPPIPKPHKLSEAMDENEIGLHFCNTPDDCPLLPIGSFVCIQFGNDVTYMGIVKDRRTLCNGICIKTSLPKVVSQTVADVFCPDLQTKLANEPKCDSNGICTTQRGAVCILGHCCPSSEFNMTTMEVIKGKYHYLTAEPCDHFDQSYRKLWYAYCDPETRNIAYFGNMSEFDEPLTMLEFNKSCLSWKYCPTGFVCLFQNIKDKLGKCYHNPLKPIVPIEKFDFEIPEAEIPASIYVILVTLTLGLFIIAYAIYETETNRRKNDEERIERAIRHQMGLDEAGVIEIDEHNSGYITM